MLTSYLRHTAHPIENYIFASSHRMVKSTSSPSKNTHQDIFSKNRRWKSHILEMLFVLFDSSSSFTWCTAHKRPKSFPSQEYTRTNMRDNMLEDTRTKISIKKPSPAKHSNIFPSHYPSRSNKPTGQVPAVEESRERVNRHHIK